MGEGRMIHRIGLILVLIAIVAVMVTCQAPLRPMP
jgi:hypothetical protein